MAQVNPFLVDLLQKQGMGGLATKMAQGGAPSGTLLRLNNFLDERDQRRSQAEQPIGPGMGKMSVLAGLLKGYSDRKRRASDDARVEDLWNEHVSEQQAAMARAAQEEEARLIREREQAAADAEAKMQREIETYRQQKAIDAEYREPKEVKPTKLEEAQAVLSDPTLTEEQKAERLAVVAPGVLEHRKSQREADKELANVRSEMERSIGLIDTMLGDEESGPHPGLRRAVGSLDGSWLGENLSFNQDTVNFQALDEELQDLLTLANSGRLTGVLSDSDLKLLRSASSGLSRRMGEKAYMDKLGQIRERLSAALSGMSQPAQTGNAGAQPSGDVDALVNKYS